MTDYNSLLDDEILAFIDKTNACYPENTASLDIVIQRKIYDAMCEQFNCPYPAGMTVRDETICDLPVRIYGEETSTCVLYFHGGGFVVGDLESHDSICAEIAASTGLQLISLDYRLSPEHGHPAAYEDALVVATYLLERAEVVLAGDSAGGTLAAAVSAELTDKIKGQVLIYPALGGNPDEGSYIQHANAPLLSLQEVIYYMGIRGGDPEDPTLNPLAGQLENIPPTISFAAECDPLYDDCFLYHEKISKNGTRSHVFDEKGLIHGYLRARHMSSRARDSFASICAAVSNLSAGRFPYGQD